MVPAGDIRVPPGTCSCFSTELWPLIYVQNVFLPNIFQINGYISRKFASFVIKV